MEFFWLCLIRWWHCNKLLLGNVCFSSGECSHLKKNKIFLGGGPLDISKTFFNDLCCTFPASGHIYSNPCLYQLFCQSHSTFQSKSSVPWIQQNPKMLLFHFIMIRLAHPDSSAGPFILFILITVVIFISCGAHHYLVKKHNRWL